MAAAEGALAGRIACVDLETTGGHAACDRIIEAGIVLLEGGAVVEEWSTLVNPGVPIPYAIQEFTGIREAMVADAPPFAEVADLIAARIDGALFVAHNARFDYGFLRSEFRRLGRRFRAPVLCTVRLSRALTPDERGHNLDAVMARHGIACDARHRALGDARVLAEFLRIARARWADADLSAIVTRLTGTSRLPPQLDPTIADELPEGPGVYFFYGEDDSLLYIGKAKNLATRVPAHFSDPHAKLERELTRLVRRIEWLETAGEFGAMVAEARLIKARRPALNRSLRDASELWAITLREDDAMPLANIAMLDALDDPGASFGLFRRELDARRALEGLLRERELCAKWLGLERGEGSCIGFQLGRCRGVCIGRELPALHAVRARLALSGLKRREWPFAGPIGIRERDWRGVEETHVFDRWCYEGEPFDLDLYRILTGFLDRPLRGAELVKPGEG
ncbi:MAG TPA: exonuclease domain-containing protein [Steroidobacteraceae bacterium]|nr:exonuclease domain-containing protein [Steroidobacteraceae bacterium]